MKASHQILSGYRAIAYVAHLGLDCGLRKYADPTDPASENLSLAEARAIAAEDPSLVWFVPDPHHPDHDAILAAIS